MPQEVKTAPASSSPQATLEGLTPMMTGEAEVRWAVEQAFGYRGDVTITLKDGSVREGYIFDRHAPASFAECRLRLIPKDSSEKISIAYDQLASLAFTGRDTAAGKSFETWVKKYREKKAAGQKNIGLEPEKLD
jgi:hypothetical protein